MGTIRNGGNGAFSGKAGSFIGSSWKNINYMKGIPKLSKRPATLKQLDQRMRFGLALGFLAQIKDLVNMGYKNQAGNRTTGLNMAIQDTLTNAIIGTYPNLSIDPALLTISKGTLNPTTGISIVQEEAGLTINWFVNLNSSAFTDDKLYVAVYHPGRKLFLTYEEAGMRGTGTAQIPLPAEFASQVLYVYLFFKQRDSNRCSPSELTITGL